MEHNQVVDGLLSLFSKANRDISTVHNKLHKEFQQVYPEHANPMRLVARLKKIEEEMSYLKDQCLELLAAKQNLSESVDNVKPKELFQKFGNILSCKVVTSDDWKSKGYGFVQFETETSAMSAIEELNGSITDGGKQMYVGKFVKKSDRVGPTSGDVFRFYVGISDRAYGYGAMESILQFAPFQSSVDEGFWHRLSSLKLNKLGIDESLISIVGGIHGAPQQNSETTTTRPPQKPINFATSQVNV